VEKTADASSAVFLIKLRDTDARIFGQVNQEFIILVENLVEATNLQRTDRRLVGLADCE